jgi:C-terminal processing protease CtpA/Prc
MKRILLSLILLGCGIVSAQISRQMQNLQAFNRLYGYVKYFHPSDEASSVDWDAFAIYGSEQVLNCTSDDELKTRLTELFLPISPTVRVVGIKDSGTFDKKILFPPDTSGYKTVAWQHLGLGMVGKPGPYESVRINRKRFVDVAAYEGKEFKLQGSVRVVRGTGKGQLWVRIDKQGKEIGFFDNMGDRPIRSQAWKEFEITGVVDQGALRLTYGCMLLEEGQLNVDNLILSIKDGSAWKEVQRSNFEGDDVGKAPKGFFAQSPGYESTVTSGDAAEGSKMVSIGSKRDQYAAQNLFEEYANVGDVATKDLGSGLKAHIPLAVYGDSVMTYPMADRKKLTELHTALAATNDSLSKSLTSQATRLADVIITWNVFQHFYPYFDIVKVNWNESFKNAITQTFNDNTHFEHLNTLRRLTAQLQDGHIMVSGSTSSGNENYALPLQWEWIEKKLVITNVLKKDLPLKVGDIVTKIDNRDAKEYFSEVEQHISAATPGWLMYRAQSSSVLGPKGSKVTVSIVDASKKSRDVVVDRSLQSNEYNSTLAKSAGREPIAKVEEGIYYINFDKASWDDISARMPDLEKATALVCDLRGYPNRNHQFIEHLLQNEDTSKRWMRVPRIVYPDQENVGYDNHGWLLKPRLPHLNAKVFFLLDGRAISYAESFMGFIEHYKLATIVGQPSAGTNGNVNSFFVPGGYQIRWTGMKVVKHDGSPLHGMGIIPDVYVAKTIKGVRENRDEYYEKALDMARKHVSKRR